MTESSTGLPFADLAVVRDLARRVGEISALPVQQERVREWQALNDLRPERPMAMIDEIPWHELAAAGAPGAEELAVVSTHPFTRSVETRLRRELYRWNRMRVDMVVRPYLDFAKVIRTTGWGLEGDEPALDGPAGDRARPDLLAHPEDVARLRAPDVWLDDAATAEIEALAHECLDGILGVRMQGWHGSDGLQLAFAIWDDVERLRGTGPVMVDLIRRPDHLHAIARRYVEIRLAELEVLESGGLLGYDQDRIHCTGAPTTSIPAAGFDPQNVRAKDTWICGRSQLFGAVSDAMFAEFVPPYFRDYYGRFGIAAFGCCEPLHGRIDAIRTIPNVRKISISPWTKPDRAAEEIGADFVFSRKPHPALVALDAWEPERAEQDLREVLEVTRANGCPVEFTLKDVTTCRGDPRRLWEWCSIAERLTRA